MEPSASEPLIRALRRLTIAISVLAVAVAILAVLNLINYLPWLIEVVDSRPNAPTAAASTSALADSTKTLDQMPLDELIDASTVIALTKNVTEAGKVKCVLSEILKQDAGVKFYWEIGDDLRWCNVEPENAYMYGDGQVMFLTGNPASIKYSFSYRDGRTGAFGDMPLTILREEIASRTRTTK